MQIELLETFLDLMETKSFNRTAERLGVTQSTVSGRVKALETALDRRLFTRSRAGTEPTAAGQRFLEPARALRREWNEARRAVRNVGAFDRALRIGIQMDLAATQAGPGAPIGAWVSEFREVLPETSFYVELDYSQQMCLDVLSGEMDFAVLFSPRHLPDLHYEPVGAVTYRMVSTHAGRRDEVVPERYIFANYCPAFDKAHRRLLPGFGGAPIASGQNAAVCGLLTSLGGSAYVLEESAQDLVASGLCRFVADMEPIQQEVYAAVHLRQRHAHPHKKLLAIVRRHFAAARQA
ncbi:MAG: LysR family transcriptional regulator [Kiloniellaceae bacterium]